MYERNQNTVCTSNGKEHNAEITSTIYKLETNFWAFIQRKVDMAADLKEEIVESDVDNTIFNESSQEESKSSSSSQDVKDDVKLGSPKALT